ncbi:MULTISPECIES: hypothetical protein [Methylomicrobium]|uniref:Uncharacterized protein n=1 Tax=Methylomicrobium album BG8 TaxID=686340 RepID=H8GLP3_METAL|nr:MULTISPECIES: hypothetical protein [Methylomicrobium]EIC30570.1 hypothetical protein Metal_2884 [Methylomicrobium album BG8]
MQTVIKKNPPPAPGPGRQKGYKTPATVRKLAVKLLQETLLDEGAPLRLRVQAACKLVDEVKP